MSQNQITPGAVPGIADVMRVREARAEAVSADGSLIAFLANTSGMDQVWLKPAAGGAPWRLTDMPERIGAISFAPRGQDLLFTMDCGGDERHQLWLVPGAQGAPVPLTAAPTVVHGWGCWSPDATEIAYASNARDPRVMDIHVMTLATRESRRVLENTGFCEVLAFSRDGGALILRGSERGRMDQDLRRLDLATGAVTPLVAAEGRVQWASVKLLKDGSGALVLSDRGGEFLAVDRLDFTSGALTPVAAVPGHDIDTLALSAGQDRLAVVVNRDGWSELRVGPLGGDLAPVSLPEPAVVNSVSFAEGDAALLMTLESPVMPAGIWRCELAEGRFTRLVEAPCGAVDRAGLVAPEGARLPGFDGLDIPHFVYHPRGQMPEAGWPVLFMVHGGPESQWKPAWRADLQHYLARGIMVVAPNVRGSVGYGRAFHEADDHEKRMDPVSDLLTLARAFAARPDVDADRIGVMGQSYGGFMVLAAITEAPRLWKTAIDLYGVANFITLLATTGAWRSRLRAAEYGDPDRIGAFLARTSPTARLDRVRCPLLIVHAFEDPRVPMEQSEQVFSTLRSLGRPVEILRIPHEGHGFARQENRVAVFSRIAGFLAETL